MNRLAEYIWLDGAEPTQGLRSKARVVQIPEGRKARLADFPNWGYDGSSTFQADGGDSDLGLIPVRVLADPLRGDGSYLVLCEVVDSAGEAHSTNGRARLRRLMEEGASEQEPTIGFEQEYTLFRDGRPLGFPENGYPGPQGPYYCGVGAGRAFGRPVVEEHTRACLDAGLMLYGINAEVMPGQWEFQVGYRGFSGESADPLTAADHLMVARYLLERVAERHGVQVSWDPKPMKGDWNGAGAHTNFSTLEMRDPRGGRAAIERAIELLAERHNIHIASYGAGLADRLTGRHETCSIDQFRGGVADRGASIRVPRHVEEKGYGYLEDRRPGANCDPYRVGAVLLETICAANRLNLVNDEEKAA
jgi:glutamine synthetase